MSRRAWLLLLLAVPACSRPPTPEEAAARIVGTWKIVRDGGKPVEIPTGQSGLIQYNADGTVVSEAVTNSGGTLKVTPVTSTYRFLDGETLEATTAVGDRVKQTRLRAVVSGDRLTLSKPDEPGKTAEFERVK